ncbi:MAG: hypothetical protein A2138_27995 [Deltaproteobacteria bacterium RBG_16_71_12]|nr:MAG: hypothetical protein A2138_27995 [Deltaproteobacteria bacterium RBG_16_71_12]
MYRHQFLSASLLLALAGACARPQVSVEVLPPRTSVTCAAPDASAAAFGRGLFDVGATADFHGAYLADLRVSVPGADAQVDGFALAYTIPDSSSIDAADYDGTSPTGDLLLVGEDEDVRVGVVESVELVPRALAVKLAADSGVGINKINYQTLGVTLTPVVDAERAEALPTTFGLDLCEGCLVEPPDLCSDVGTYQPNPVVCRVGQDVSLFLCGAGGA